MKRRYHSLTRKGLGIEEHFQQAKRNLDELERIEFRRMVLYSILLAVGGAFVMFCALTGIRMGNEEILERSNRIQFNYTLPDIDKPLYMYDFR